MSVEMANMEELRGDATLANACGGRRMIVHVVNSFGMWGRGFVMALSYRYGECPKEEYRKWYTQRNSIIQASSEEITRFRLGGVQVLELRKDLYLGNMLAQQGIRGRMPQISSDERGCDPRQGNFPLRYSALKICLENVVVECKQRGISSVHMPRIGAGLGGGDWDYIREIIKCIVVEGGGIQVYVYY